MAYDKVVDSSVLDSGLKSIADAIRAKGGTSENLVFPTGMAAAVSAIQTGGGGGASEVVLVSDCSNASQVYNLFRPMCDEDAECNVFAYKGDASTLGINNKLVYLFLHKHSPDAGGSSYGTTAGAYVRYRNSAYSNECNVTNAYDLRVSAGDTYIHWALKL